TRSNKGADVARLPRTATARAHDGERRPTDRHDPDATVADLRTELADVRADGSRARDGRGGPNAGGNRRSGGVDGRIPDLLRLADDGATVPNRGHAPGTAIAGCLPDASHRARRVP